MKKNGEVFYPRLEAEIAKRGILKRDIYKTIAMEHSTFCYKLNGKRPFTLEQGMAIWKTWFSDIPIDELFAHDKEELKWKKKV